VPDLFFPSEIQDLAKFGMSEEVIPKVDLMYLYGIMFYPHDDVARARVEQSFVAENVATAISEAKEIFENVWVDADVALSLADAPKLHSELYGALEAGGFAGAVSGMILGWIVFRHERPDTHASASLRGAFRMVEKACIKGRIRGGTVDNLRRNVWPVFRPAAHLWAALQVWRDRGFSSEELGTPQGMYLFLMMSEWFRLKGEACIPQRANAPILDANETWKVRAEISKGWATFDLQCRDLDAWDLGTRIKKRPR
jgi:hypothetical protein